MILHVDDASKLVLINKMENNGSGSLISTRKDWSEGKFTKRFIRYFKPRQLFRVSTNEYIGAIKAMDLWIRDEYGGEILEDYLQHDALPKDLEKKFPKFYKHYWDILTRVNQNKNCTYQTLVMPIPSFDELKISNFSGFKVKGPFETDRNNYFNTLKLVGRMNDIDRFCSIIKNN